MGALIRLSFFLRCFVYFCLQKGTVAFLRSVGYISKACFEKPTITVTEVSNSVSNSPESSSEKSFNLSLNEFTSSTYIDTPKKYKSNESHREIRTKTLQSVRDSSVVTDGLNQTNDQYIETSELLKIRKDEITIEAESFLESISNQNKSNTDNYVEADEQNIEFKTILQIVSNQQNVKDQQNEKEIIKNYALLFALPDTEKHSDGNTFCPQCNNPCDVEDINDYGKCTLCKQRELRDPSVHRVRNSDERSTFFSNPVDKKFLPREKSVVSFEKQRKEQEERLTYSPKSSTLPTKLNNNSSSVSASSLPILENQNGRFSSTSSIQESLYSTRDIIPNKKIIEKLPQGENTTQNNISSSEEFTDSENYINLREILDTEVFGRIDDNYAVIVNLMRVSTHISTFADTFLSLFIYLNLYCTFSGDKILCFFFCVILFC